MCFPNDIVNINIEDNDNVSNPNNYSMSLEKYSGPPIIECLHVPT